MNKSDGNLNIYFSVLDKKHCSVLTMKAFNLFRYNNNNVNFAEFIDIYMSKKYFHKSHTLSQTISALLQSSEVEKYNTIFNVYM